MKLFGKLPGSHKMRNRARKILKCHRVNDKLWLVWGGDANHNVKINDDSFSCDCSPFSNGHVSLCSHIIKVKMEMGIFPSLGRLPS